MLMSDDDEGELSVFVRCRDWKIASDGRRLK